MTPARTTSILPSDGAGETLALTEKQTQTLRVPGCKRALLAHGKLEARHRKDRSEQEGELYFCLATQVPQTSLIHLGEMIDPNGLFITYFFQQCKLKAILDKRHALCCGHVRGGKETLLPPTAQPPRKMALSFPPSLPIQL